MSSFSDENNIPAAIRIIKRRTRYALDDTGEKMVEKIEEGFDDGRDALGRPWAPLSPETIRRKGHATILVDEGEMRESFEYAVNRSSLTLAVGTNSEIAVYHEFGVPDRGLPARPIVRPAATWAAERYIEPKIAEEYNKGFARLTL